MGIWGARNAVSANASLKIQSFSLETTPLVKKTTQGNVKYALEHKITKKTSLSSFTLWHITAGLGVFGMEKSSLLLVIKSLNTSLISFLID